MLATNAAWQVLAHTTALLYCHFNKLTYAILIQNLEWVNIKNLLFKIRRQEASNVVTTITECHLGKVVSTKAKVFCHCCNLVGSQCSTRNLDHCSYLKWNLYTFCLEELASSLSNDFLLCVQLVYDTYQWHHNFWMRIETFLL